MGEPKWWGRACDELRAGDPVLGAIIDRFPGEQLEPRAAPFFTLARAITVTADFGPGGADRLGPARSDLRRGGHH